MNGRPVRADGPKHLGQPLCKQAQHPRPPDVQRVERHNAVQVRVARPQAVDRTRKGTNGKALIVRACATRVRGRLL